MKPTWPRVKVLSRVYRDKIYRAYVESRFYAGAKKALNIQHTHDAVSRARGITIGPIWFQFSENAFFPDRIGHWRRIGFLRWQRWGGK